MFTGIVEERGSVVSLDRGVLRIKACKSLSDTSVGDSLAVNGACLTVTDINAGEFSTDVTPETLTRTNLVFLNRDHRVNLERSIHYGDKVGGHLVEGHIDSTVRISDLTTVGNSTLMRLETDQRIIKYIVEKGFVALDGVSFTVTDVINTSFAVSVIPYTLELTTFLYRAVDDLINIEVDIVAKYIEKLVSR